jgi:hypothetical protein
LTLTENSLDKEGQTTVINKSSSAVKEKKKHRRGRKTTEAFKEAIKKVGNSVRRSFSSLSDLASKSSKKENEISRNLSALSINGLESKKSINPFSLLDRLKGGRDTSTKDTSDLKSAQDAHDSCDAQGNALKSARSAEEFYCAHSLLSLPRKDDKSQKPKLLSEPRKSPSLDNLPSLNYNHPGKSIQDWDIPLPPDISLPAPPLNKAAPAAERQTQNDKTNWSGKKFNLFPKNGTSSVTLEAVPPLVPPKEKDPKSEKTKREKEVDDVFFGRRQLHPTFVARYELGELLGDGAFGFVFTAKRKFDDKEVRV